jgi:hypothetical protein
LEASGDRPYFDLEVGVEGADTRYVIRKFDTRVMEQELYWHRDDESRDVEVLECGEGWKVQLDNKLPIEVEPGTKIFILRHEWHRVIKGSGDLLIKIYKHGKEEAY